jgi:hypothetical protein
MQQASFEVRTEDGVMDGLITAPESCLDVPRLLQLFEGLGDSCDFGMVQRAVGIEPFGLFRFAACSAVQLGSLLRNRFEHFGEPDDLWLDEVGRNREYRVRSRLCSSFWTHTKRFVDRDDPEMVRSAQIESIRFLKKKLMRDMSLGRRLFVYRGPANFKAIREIAVQLRTYGDNCLLWVKLPDATQSPGTVEHLTDGLLRGFVSRFGVYDPRRTPRLPVEEWIAVCANAYRFWRKADPPTAPLKNLISESMTARRCRWSGHPSASNRQLDEPTATGGAVIEHKLGRAESTSVYRVNLPVAVGGTFTFSVWAFLPEGFRGQRVAASLPGCSAISNWTADAKSPGRWQRLWVTATLPADARSISCELIAEGAVGDVFRSASWCLERRNQPSGYGFELLEM